MKTMYDFDGRVALVTGAVGNLGAATARALHAAQASSVLVDRSQSRLEDAYPDLRDSQHHWLAGDVDLSDAEAVERLLRRTVDRFGRLDLLVNTVGGFHGGAPLHQESLDAWDLMLKVNLRTALLCCRAAVPYFLERGSGRVVNIAATAGRTGVAGLAAYSAAKGALMRMSESLAAELKSHGITVNCVLPGIIDTPQNRAAMPDADFTTWVEPEAIAGVILFLGSDAARAVTAAAIPVTGRG